MRIYMKSPDIRLIYALLICAFAACSAETEGNVAEAVTLALAIDEGVVSVTVQNRSNVNQTLVNTTVVSTMADIPGLVVEVTDDTGSAVEPCAMIEPGTGRELNEINLAAGKYVTSHIDIRTIANRYCLRREGQYKLRYSLKQKDRTYVSNSLTFESP